jgi:hypothetical protein
MTPQDEIFAKLRLRDASAFIAFLTETVRDGACTLDMWSDLDRRIKRTIDWSGFYTSYMFGDFCNATRERHPMTLTDIMMDCNPTRVRFLEQYMRESSIHAGNIGNVLFWLDVQSTFLPLVHETRPPNMFSIAFFDEIQMAVRRIFNTYLADTPSTPTTLSSSTRGSTVIMETATIVTDETKRDVLSRILLYQGEPNFLSTARYLSLFKPAQDQVWKWLETKIFPNFKNSLHYVQCILESVELLDIDPYLMKATQCIVHAMKEEARAKRTPSVVTLTTTTTRMKGKNNSLSTLLIPNRYDHPHPLDHHHHHLPNDHDKDENTDDDPRYAIHGFCLESTVVTAAYDRSYITNALFEQVQVEHMVQFSMTLMATPPQDYQEGEGKKMNGHKECRQHGQHQSKTRTSFKCSLDVCIGTKDPHVDIQV